jgi:tetratricopeptide (TPR) repeat protein
MKGWGAGIGVFSPEKAGEYLGKVTGLPEDEDGNRGAVAAELGYWALALALAASFIAEKRKTQSGYRYGDYLESLRRQKVRTSAAPDSAPLKDRQAVLKAWRISSTAIASEGARQLLNLFAFFAPDDIDPDWFRKGYAHLPLPLQQIVQDRDGLNGILRELGRYSLIDSNRKAAVGLHRLLQRVIRDALGGERERWRSYCVAVLNECCSSDFFSPRSGQEFQAIVSHIQSVTARGRSSKPAEKANLCMFCGMGYVRVMGNYAKALAWCHKALVIRKKVLGEYHPDTATTYNEIAGAYDSLGDYDEALIWYQKALAVHEKVSGENHPDTAATCDDIALLHERLGDGPGALEWYQRVLAINEKGLGKAHPDTATTYSNIACVYGGQGDYSEALAWYRKALDIFEEVLGKDHPDTATAYHGVGGVYESQGDCGEALAWYRKALTIREKVLGKDHPDTAMTYNDMAVVYDIEGDYDKALTGCLDAYRIFRLKLGEDHPNTQSIRENMEHVYLKMDNDEPFDEWLAGRVGEV